MNTERLLKLADHLESGKLLHPMFDYTVYNLVDDQSEEEIESAGGNVCGTAGCAIGEAPAIWPDKFKFDRNYVVLKNSVGEDSESTCTIFSEWFGISTMDYRFLFLPCDLDNPLSQSASPKEVAQHIRKFVEYGGIYTT